MSRIGKKPIPLPDKVKVSVAAGNEITVTGPRGELTAQFPREIGVEVQEQEICVTRPTDSGRHRALHGLVRSLVANMITGVSEGFQKRLEIQGVGYRAEMDGKRLRLRLGFSHEVLIEPSEDLELATESPTLIVVSGNDKCAVGQMAANIRKLRPVEPYKGKGIRYVGEKVRRKAGKQAKIGA
ncbi:MAG: 50S ribosomal protein L6 [candidate division WS1 bacterium]|jgi:large subunit ribosomal protein L6|nr:50S ribosomal protein L6 [candidate division WS1 bacterium]